MKKFLQIVFLSLAVTLSGVKGFAQNYKSIFGDNTTQWTIMRGVCDAECTDTFSVTIDTVINSLSYKKVVSGYNGFGFLREDTITGQVWFYQTSQGMEYLVMDLSLSTGDTFIVFDFINTPNKMYVDSVFYKNGLKHVRFNYWIELCGQYEKMTFVEGNISNAGMFYQATNFSPLINFYLLCSFKDGYKSYGNTYLNDSCYACYVGINETTNKFSFSISPNPTTGIFTLTLSGVEGYSSPKITFVEILNVMGEKAYSEKILIPDSLILNLEAPKGIYFVKATDANRNFRVKKIIIQ